MALVVSVVSPQVWATPPSHGKAKPPAGHPNWRPAQRTPAPIAVQPHPAVAKKRPATTVRELTGKRTATTSYFQMSDGGTQAQIAGIAVNYRDAAGRYQKIDTGVGAVREAGFELGNRTNTFTSLFGRSTDRLVRVQQGGRFVEFGLPGKARPVSPRIAGSTVTYPQLVAGVDLVYEVTSTSLKEKLVLSRAPAAPLSLVFTLHTGGVSATQQEDGSIAFAAGPGAPVFTMPAPFMYDAQKQPAAPAGFATSEKVTQTLASGTVTIRADQRWLASPERKYPVVIDPTVSIQPVPTDAEDVQIYSGAPTTNYNNTYQLKVGTDTSDAYRTLVQFPLTGVPSGTVLSSASLQLYYDQTHTTWQYDVPMEARRVTASWADSSATWSSMNTKYAEAGTAGTTKLAAKSSVWSTFNVLNIAQAWLTGTQPNYGFMVKAVDEATKGRGGPIYEASQYAYMNAGRTDNVPKLVLSWGRPGVTLASPTTLTATGAALSWSAYTDPTPNDTPADDIAEYQVHRSVYQTFTPSAATLVAPVAAGTLSYQDSSATPTPADSTDPFGRYYYYMVAVKTKDGQVIASATQGARLPKAGRVTQIYRDASDTTLGKGVPDTNLNVYDGDPYDSPGNNNPDYGVTRAVLKFPALTGIPTGAQVVDAQLNMWTASNLGPNDPNSGTVDVHRLTRGFDQATATWNRANTATAWTTPGGDYAASPESGFNGFTNDPEWENWSVLGAVKTWLATPSSNFGLLLKMHDETTPTQRIMMLSNETAEPLLRPTLLVSYTVKDAASTYYAPNTAATLAAATQSTDTVTLTNTTTRTLPKADYVLSYHWALPDGSDATAGTSMDTPLPADLTAGASVTLTANLKTPTPVEATNGRSDYTLRWELRNKTTNTWLSVSDGITSLDQHVALEQPTSDELGLEKFYQYSAVATGAGGAALVNLHAGNLAWSYNAFSNPSGGLASFARLTYNSLDTSASSIGYGWSLAATTLTRLNTPLDFLPPGQDYPTQITATDGDGTSHQFTLNKHGSSDTSVWDYDHPHGVHLYLQKTTGADTSRSWVMTAPDRTQFFFDDEGYQTAIIDKNGNTMAFTYAERKSNNAPRKFLQYLTDPANRQTLTLAYYAKGDAYTYIDDTGTEIQASNLTNPKIIDNVKTLTDVSGRQLQFVYTDKGLLAKLVDGAGNPAAKTFRFGYDQANTNKNTKLVSVTDPRGYATALKYFDAPTDPKFKWAAQTITDRAAGATRFAYTDPDGPQGGQINTSVTDPENHTSAYVMDALGRPTSMTNAKNQTTTLGWDADHNVTRLQEDNAAVSTFSYDANTGYPLTSTDAEAQSHGWPATQFAYATGLNGHIASLVTKASPEGRTWSFGYDPAGDLTSLTDPAGSATPTVGDYTTSYTYDPTGQLRTATDANQHTTTFDDYQPSGYPQTITDAKQNPTTTTYDARGNVLSVKDANQHTASFGYDVFGRPLDSTVPIDQASGRYIITPAPVYDGNDNITQSRAPNGALTTADYDNLDRATAVHQPKNTTSDPERVTSYSYDKLGNVLTTTEPKGTLTPSDPNDFVTRNTYDEIYQLTASTDAAGGKTSYGYDTVGNLTTVTDPVKNTNPGTTTTDGYYQYTGFGNVYNSTNAPFYGSNTTITNIAGMAVTPTGKGYWLVGSDGTRYPHGDASTIGTAVGPPYANPIIGIVANPLGGYYQYTAHGNVYNSTDATFYGSNTSITNIVGMTMTPTGKGYWLVGSDGTRYPHGDATTIGTALGPPYAHPITGIVATPVTVTATPAPTSTTDYDLDHRPIKVTDAAGNHTSTGYDHDGNITSTSDPTGSTTLITRDARALTKQVDVPFKPGTAITYKTTQYAYDQVGNRTKVTSPRGAATTSDPNDYATSYVYDELNRVIEQDLPYNAADPTYNTPDKITNSYDPVGRLTKVSAPPSQGQTARNDTSYSYFDNGWTKTSTDAWDILTAYDYNELGEQTSRTLTSAGGSSARTMGWAYNPDGTLKSRADSGIPAGLHVVLVDDSDTQNVKATGTWPTTTGAGYGLGYHSHPAGTGTNTFAWTLNIPQDGTYQVYVRYPASAASNAPYKIDYQGGTDTKTINQTTQAGQWVSLGSYPFAQGNAGKITLSDNANGAVAADAVKLVRDNSGDPPPGPNAYANTYDPNGNLTEISDSSPGAAINDYAISYDGVDRVAQIQEKLAGTVKHTTSYTYDPNSDPLTQTHDTQIDTFDYDVRNLLATVTNKTSTSDPNPKITRYTYTPAATTATETKDNGNTLSYDYNLDWTLSHQVEKKPSGTVVAEHTLDYDLNGNKTRDQSSVQNADNHAQMINRVTVDSYDPRDRTASVTETNPDTGATVSAETYTHDAANNVTTQTINATTTSFGYDRNRLVTATTAGATVGYNYDPFGRLDTATTADGTQTERYTYDGYDRVTTHTRQGSGTSTYSYDPFDRTTSETTDAGGANQKTTNHAYLGLTNQLLTDSVNGQVTKTYQYSPTGQRLSQTTLNPGGATETADYAYNSHGDVEALTDTNGDTKTTYGYTAYGTNQTSDFTGIDKPDPADPTKQPFNVYRYDAKRFDPATGTIDMGFRNYNPTLNQFLTRDTYNGALNDQNLTTNPWTGNRYAFTGGNPTTLIELDGHEPGSWCDTSSCYGDLLKGGMNANGPTMTPTRPTVGVSGSRGNPVNAASIFLPVVSDALPWVQDATAAAEKAGVDPALVLAIAMQESSGKEVWIGEEKLADFNALENNVWALGLFPKADGPSFGITNMKEEAFNQAKALDYQHLGGRDFSALITDRKLQLEATAYYVKYLQTKYVSKAPANVRENYSTAEIVYGIYQGSLEDYLQNVTSTGQFGENTSKYLYTFTSYYGVAARMVCRSKTGSVQNPC
jgi:RHS repeat-associated protein